MGQLYEIAAGTYTSDGAVANIELSHGGKYAGLASIGGHKKERRPAYGPSHDILPSGEEVLEMPQKLIYEILDAYGAAADVAKRAGFATSSSIMTSSRSKRVPLCSISRRAKSGIF